MYFAYTNTLPRFLPVISLAIPSFCSSSSARVTVGLLDPSSSAGAKEFQTLSAYVPFSERVYRYISSFPRHGGQARSVWLGPK